MERQKQTINFVLCDDEPAQSEFLSHLVRRWSANKGIAAHILFFESAERFLFWYTDKQQVDILLLDIQMGGMDGVALARKLRQSDAHIPIVFITGYTEFMSQGYDVQALHYLMKPVKEDKLFEVLNRAYKSISQTASRSLLVAVDGETHRLPFSEIIFLEAQGHYVAINTAESVYKTKANITAMEKMLDEAFFRCQRSFIVNLRYIRKVTRRDIMLENGREIPLSRGLYEDINQAIIRYYP